jgi:hypothetical protein
VLEVSVLDTGFDDVQGSGDDEGCAGAEDGGDEVLAPGCGVVVLEGEDVFFCEGGATEELSIVSIGLSPRRGIKGVQQMNQARYEQPSIQHRGTNPFPHRR